ncbi:virginiamycin B lyase family protein [Nocardioides conyzicola]|uniref:Fibronectin type-III domain-containing protein n=1 Tax=Nocardioides conyzicola TaxID=1651781 RepID=A0ABP8WLR4_9ACTN
MRPTTRIAATGLSLLLAVAMAPAAPVVAATVQPFATESATNGIVLGPDGNLWVAEQFNDTVAQLSPTGAPLASLPVGANPTAVTTGPGGTVWVAVTGADKLVWIDAASASPTAHDVPTPSGCGPAAIASGGDGRMYFSCSGASKLGSVKDDGTDVVAADVGAGLVFDLAVTNGHLFAPDYDGDAVRRFALGRTLVLDGTVAMPSGSSGPDGIAADGAGRLWVTAYNSSQILRFPATQNLGTATVVPLTGGTLGSPFGIVASADGWVYATGKESGNLVRISSDGSSSTFYDLPAGAQAFSVVDGPAGDLYVTDQGQSRILRFVNSAPRVTSRPASSVASTGATASATVSPQGNATQVVFDYGTSTAYGRTTPAQTLAAGGAPVTVARKLTGLKPGTRYHVRVRATNGEGSTVGTDVVFTTKPARLAVTTTFSVTHGSTTVIKQLRLAKLRGGETVAITCSGKGCPFKAKTFRHLKKGQRSFGAALWKGSKLRPGVHVSVRVTAPKAIGRSTVLTVRKGKAPRIVQACLQPGATKPTRC